MILKSSENCVGWIKCKSRWNYYGNWYSNDLGADSLDAVELMMALEEEFDIQIQDEDAQKFKTIKDIVTF